MERKSLKTKWTDKDIITEVWRESENEYPLDSTDTEEDDFDSAEEEMYALGLDPVLE